MTTEDGFDLKSGFRIRWQSQEMVLVLFRDSWKYCVTKESSTSRAAPKLPNYKSCRANPVDWASPQDPSPRPGLAPPCQSAKEVTERILLLVMPGNTSYVVHTP